MQLKKISDIEMMAWFLRPYWLQALFVFSLLFIYALFETLSVGALYPFVSKILSKSDSTVQYGGKILEYLDSVSAFIPISDKLVAASLLLLVLTILSRIFGIISESTSLWYHLRLYADLQNRIFHKILLNQYSYFHNKKHGELMFIGGEAAKSVGEMFFYFPKAGVEFFRIVIISVLLFTISVQFTFLLYAVIVVFSIMVYFLSNRIINPAAKIAQIAYANITTLFSESIAGIRQIKLFNSYKYWFQKMDHETGIARKQQFKYTAPAYFSSHLVLSVGSLSTIFAIIYTKLYMPDQFFNIFPIVIVYIGALMRLMPSVKEIAHQWMGLKGLAPRIRITYETLADTHYEMDDSGKDFPGLTKEIKLENVSFSYATRNDVLKNINITIPKNKTVAIVGESGSGKSTLADMLLRLYVPSEGKILVDGIDYQNYSRSSWLSHMSMVSQDSFIFHASVEDNIRVGRLNANDKEIVDAANIANAHQFILELPEKYDTTVGDRGITLSGGQCQRLAIARALIKNPEILILDEATSSLDNISEKAIQDSLREVEKNRTTVIIAHRLSTIEHADKIFVMKRGNIMEEGTHEELLGKGGYYHALYQREKEGITNEP
jgi:ABC-type multidrug transport system fused ATPase/permease subunit